MTFEGFFFCQTSFLLSIYPLFFEYTSFVYYCNLKHSFMEGSQSRLLDLIIKMNVPKAGMVVFGR